MAPGSRLKVTGGAKEFWGKVHNFRILFNKKILASIFFYSCSTLNFQFKGMACLVVRELHAERDMCFYVYPGFLEIP